MIIGGLQKFSLLDYPGKISAIVFVKGCNFRCQFCYNPMLVLPLGANLEENHSVSEDDFFRFLKARLGKLNAVVITGGEPTIFKDLPEFINKIKKMGFLVKLDTNGTNPEMLSELIKAELVNFIAMDVKNSFKKYQKITGVEVDFKKIEKSVKIIKESGLPYEFRTTMIPGWHDKRDVEAMGELITGGSNWFLQSFKSDSGLVNEDLKGKRGFTKKEMAEFAQIGGQYVVSCRVR